MYRESSRPLLDKICQIAAIHLRADIACILDCRDGSAQRLRGAFGCLFNRVTGPASVPGMILDEQDTVYFETLTRQKWFAGHALKKLAPGAKTLLVSSFGDGANYLAVFNPNVVAFKRPESVSLLAGLVSLATIQIDSMQALERTISAVTGAPLPNALDQTGLREGMFTPEDFDGIFRFLDESLFRRQLLRTKGGVTFMTLRNWRSHAADIQIASLNQFKRQPTAVGVKSIADEIVAFANAYSGPNFFDAVVPMPCTNSEPIGCLSEKMAEAVASILGISYLPCLAAAPSADSSVPRQRKLLGPFLVKKPVAKKVLLVDDVVTTGARITRAVHVLRDAGAYPTPIAWIGPAS